MGTKDCNKYFDKADRIDNEIKALEEDVKNLLSFPKNPKTDKRILELKGKIKELEEKKEATLRAGYDCVSSQH